jgi:hypothetical protein
MQPGSEPQRAWRYWPCAAILALSSIAPAFADNDQTRQETKENWFALMNNPCVKNPAPTNGKDDRIDETIECKPEANPNGCGILRTETRTKDQGDKQEQRTRTRGDGFGIGNLTLVRYSIALDNTTVIRTRPGESRIKVFNREMGHPQKTTTPTGSSSGMCSPANLAACASPFVVTTKSETRNGVPIKPEAEPDVECKNRDGSPRGPNQD